MNEIDTAISKMYKNSIYDHAYVGYDMRELAKCKICYAVFENFQVG